MATQTLSTSRGFSQSLRYIVGAPVRLQTYRNVLYLGLMFPLMIPFVIIYHHLLTIGFSIGGSLSIILSGIPIVILTLVLAVGMAPFERKLARVLLRADIPVSSLDPDQTSSIRIKQFVLDRWTWTAVIYLLSKFIAGIAVFYLLLTLLATSVSLLLAPLYYEYIPAHIYVGSFLGVPPVIEFTPEVLFGWDTLLVGLTTTIRIDLGQIASLPTALLVAGIGVVLLLVSLQLFNTLAWVWGRYTTVMLKTPRYWTGLTQ